MKQRNTFEFPETLVVNLIGIKSPKSYEIEDLIKIICYNIYEIKNCTINVICNNRITQLFSKDDLEIGAILDKTPIDHTYNLYISSNISDNLELIICHEICHLYQYERGDLQIIKNANLKYFKWKGKNFIVKTDYWSRPWEKEAKEESYRLWKEFKKLYYK